MEQIHTAIQAATNKDASSFREAIGSALAAKIEDALELKKIEIASTMFKQTEEQSEQEMDSNEDV